MILRDARRDKIETFLRDSWFIVQKFLKLDLSENPLTLSKNEIFRKFWVELFKQFSQSNHYDILWKQRKKTS